jgi:hypothetical protein
MKFLPKFIFLFFTSYSQAQSWVWDTVVPQGGALVKDHASGYYTYTGFTNNSGYTYHFQHVDSLGNNLWTIDFKGTCYIMSAVLGDDSCLYAGGHFLDSVRAGNIVAYTTGQWDGFIAKITPAGNVAWIKCITGPGEVQITGIGAGPGRIYMTGAFMDQVNFPGLTTFSTSPLFSEVYVAAIDLSGSFIQAKTTTTISSTCSNSWGFHVQCDASGNVFLVFMQHNAFNWGSVPFNYTNMYVLSKMDNTLNAIWTAPVMTWTTAYPPRLRINSVGEPILLTSMIDDTTTLGYQLSYQALYKYSTTGSLLAVFSPTQMPCSCQGSTYIATVYYTVSFDLDSCDNIYLLGTTGKVLSNGGGTPLCDMVIYQLSPGLQPTWVRSDPLNATLWSTWPEDIVVESVNKCFISGFFYPSIVLHDSLVADTNFHYFARLHTVFGSPAQLASSSLTICPNAHAVLQATAGGLVNWYPSFTSATPLGSGNSYTAPILQPGSYTYYADASTCTMTTGRTPFQFTVLPGPTVTVNSGSVCQGKTFTLSPAGALSYTFPMVYPVFVPPASGIYTIVGADAFGCINTGTSNITVYSLPFVNIFGLNRVCAGTQQTLTASGAQSYTWNTGIHTPTCVVAPLTTTAFTANGTGANGCISGLAITINVEVCNSISQTDPQELDLFPNPFKEQLFIKVSNPGCFEIRDAMGRLFLEGIILSGENTVDASGLPAGLLMIQLRTESGETIQKLVHE